MVVIRGQVTTWQDSSETPTYQELKAENDRLRQEITALRAQQDSQPPTAPAHPVQPSKSMDYVEYTPGEIDDRLWKSLASESSIHRSYVSDWEDIIMPHAGCIEKLVEFDMIWNSWVHYALEYPKFKEESDAFAHSLAKGSTLEQADVSWLAVFFSVISTALLMMEDDEAQSLPLPAEFTIDQVSQNWYDAAIFCLYKADFLRVPNIQNVQAIAVLCMTFNNRGDSELGHHLRVSAIRTAQTIQLGEDKVESVGQYLTAEGERRLWWTLVICEWLNLTHQSPFIDESDFRVSLPSVSQPEAETGAVDPVHYHIFMAQTSQVICRFRVSLKHGKNSLDNVVNIVKAADEGLASIIETLPSHLQPEGDSSTNAEIQALELAQPWIKWQRYDLTLVLLHLRMYINRALQKLWLSSPGEAHWARTLSVTSAMSLIWINRSWDQPASTRKQWALSYHIYSSAMFLLRECQYNSLEDKREYLEAVEAGLVLLDAVESHNLLARHAARVLRESIRGSEL
ncbi:hypothetical protein FBEOM_1821 [Fusarium beomiforme]|uniref:Xylanolytic transcriptional activator regulatory domain-containing protein n=1 Tax=Fusarium beomiforme TaxID=44412 RepID=A0A9P5AUU5_9HYPO|nr:hypothetical protein FBEOM_1821 [Fusarium beomiforme]